jgi:hypothetical protein
MNSATFPDAADTERASTCRVGYGACWPVVFDVLKWIGAVVLAVALALDGIGV